MEITYLGHSSFKIKGKNVSIVTDPYDSDEVGLKFTKTEADIVTISHDHSDHNKSDAVTDVSRVIKGPGEYEIAGTSIIGISSFHDNESGQKRGKNTIYILEVDDIKIVHLGDLGHLLNEKQREDLGEIDVLLVPVGGFYTINPVEAKEVVLSLEPKIIVPMHFQTEGLNPAIFKELSPVEEFISQVGFKTEKLPKLTLKKEDLVNYDEVIVVLEKK